MVGLFAFLRDSQSAGTGPQAACRRPKVARDFAAGDQPTASLSLASLMQRKPRPSR